MTKVCSQVVSKVRHTVVEVWQQDPQLQGLLAVLFVLVAFRVGAKRAESVGSVIVEAVGATVCFVADDPVRLVVLADDITCLSRPDRIKHYPGGL